MESVFGVGVTGTTTGWHCIFRRDPEIKLHLPLASWEGSSTSGIRAISIVFLTASTCKKKVRREARVISFMFHCWSLWGWLDLPTAWGNSPSILRQFQLGTSEDAGYVLYIEFYGCRYSSVAYLDIMWCSDMHIQTLYFRSIYMHII